MRKLIMTALAAAALTFGQEAKPAEAPKAPKVQKIFQVKYADVGSLTQIIQSIASSVTFDKNLRVLAVSGTPEAVAAIEDAINGMDCTVPVTSRRA